MKTEGKSRDEQKLLNDISTFGWHIILISATEYLPSFGYTVGLTKNFNHPELISFGLKTDTIHAILNNAGELVRNGERITTDKNYVEIFSSSPAQFIKVDNRNLRDYFGYGIWYYEGVNFDALQLIWTDRKNRFPWQKDFEEEFKYHQPLLDRNADFKFKESESLGVFTNRQHIEEGMPILYVVHEKDGDWQFLTGDEITDNDIKTVCLKEMIERDSTLNEVFNLDYGEQAKREQIGGKWKRTKSEEINE